MLHNNNLKKVTLVSIFSDQKWKYLVTFTEVQQTDDATHTDHRNAHAVPSHSHLCTPHQLSKMLRGASDILKVVFATL